MTQAKRHEQAAPVPERAAETVLPNMLCQADKLTLAASPLARTRNAGKKRDYKCLADGPINAEILRDAAAQAQIMRRARAALPRDPNEPPRKRGRPRKERPLAADGSPPSTPSDKSTDTDVSMRQFFTRGHPAEEKEGADDLEAFRTPPSLTPPGSPTQRGSREIAQDIRGGNICYNEYLNAMDKPVNSHSPPKDVAALLLAVAEKLWLETAEQAHSPQSSNDSSKATNIIKTKGRKGRSRRRRC